MRAGNTSLLLLLLISIFITVSCNNSGEKKSNDPLDTGIHGIDTSKHYYEVVDSGFYVEPAVTEKEIEQYKKVKNLLEFHTKDSMKVDSTYIATLAMGKNISPAEMEMKLKPIAEPGGKVQVSDTTQEIGFRMAATLEDKASSKDPNFMIELIGGANNIRVYDPVKNKIVWQWNVTPLKAGTHELILSISQVDSMGYDAGSPETRHHNITIFSGHRKSGFIKSVGTFFANNWQWLIGAVLVPLLIVWLNIRNRSRSHQSAPAVPTTTANKNWKRKKR